MTAYANWRDDAACRDADPDLFFPVGTTGPVLRQIDEAKRICRACPAQGQCLAWALDQPITDGVWGGTTEDERRSIRSLWRSTTTSQEGDDDNGYQRAEHREHGTHARAAQTQATGIFGDVGIGRGHGETGATREAPGHPRQAVGLPKEKGSWHTGTPNVTSLSYVTSKPKPGSCSRAWTSRIQSSQPGCGRARLTDGHGFLPFLIPPRYDRRANRSWTAGTPAPHRGRHEHHHSWKGIVMDLHGQRVVILGGTSGIGLATAKAAARCPGPGRRGRTAGSTWRGAQRADAVGGVPRSRAGPHGPAVPDLRRHRVRVRVPGAFRPRRWAAYPAQLLDGPLLNLVCDARDALRERLRRHRGHALAAAVGRVQLRRDLAREIRPLRVADVGDRPAGVTKIIEHGRQRLAQLAVHEMPLPAIWHTGC